MAEDDIETLGLAVQRLRKSLGLTQDELGERAGYRAGAAVSISRFENGQITPGPEKIHGIAEALGVTRDQLAELAAGESARQAATNVERPKEKGRRVDREVAEREKALTAANNAFKSAQERAKVDFLMRLSEIGARIEGAQPIELLPSPKSAAPAASGNASTAQENSFEVLSGVPTTGAAVGLMLSLLRGAKVLPIGGIAVPVIAAVAGAAVSGVIAVRRQQQERARQIDRAQAELMATKSNFTALMSLLPRATEILSYIAVHAGHALERWDRQLGTPTPAWDDLEDDAKKRFLEFLELSGAAINVLTIDFEALAKAQDRDDLGRQAVAIDELLVRSHGLATARA